MRQRRRPLLWALLAVVTLTAACEANASPGGAATAPTSISEPDNVQATAETGPSMHMAWPDGAGIEPTVITVPAPADARPAHVEIERTLDYDMTTGPIPTVRAISLEGVALVDSMDAAAFDTDTWTLTATTPVNLWTDSGLEPVGDTTALVPGDPHRQVISGAFVSETVTWKETASTDMFQSDWRMFRRDIDGGEVEVLARSEQVHPEGRLPRAVGGPMLAPFGDRVAWHTTYAREDGTLRTKLVSVPATGGELRDEADLVAMPEGVDDGWVVLRMIDQTVAGAEEGWEIQDANTVASIDLIEPGGSARPLVVFPRGTSGNTWGIAEIAAGGGDVYAWVASDGEVYTASLDGETVVRLRQADGLQPVPHSLAVCDERVIWSAAGTEDGAGSATYLFDPADGQVTRLPSGSSVGDNVCGGSYIAWTETDIEDPDARTLILVRQQ